MLPQDPVILVSYLNTQLRDNYSSLADLCSSLDVDEAELKRKLREIGYRYDKQQNKFV